MRTGLSRWAMPLVVLLLAATGCSSSDSGGGASPSSDAALSALAVSAGSLSPAFASEVVTYAVTVSNSTTTFQVTPTARSSRAYAIQVKQNAGAFTTVASGAASPVYAAPAPGASSSFMVRVIAEDEATTKAYAIIVNRERALFTNADLASLGVSGASLSPTFVASVTSYAATVPYGTASVTVTSTVAEPHATVQLKQDSGSFVTVASGSASAALTVPAYPGSTTVTVRVTAEDGTTKDYVSTVAQAAPAADDTLSALTISGASLSPAFSAGQLTYTSTLSNGTATFTVTPTANEAHATIQVKQDSGAFAAVASGSASASLTAPAPGGAPTTITVRVTAQSGAFQDYVITVDETASLSADASLSALAISGTTLSPSFTTGNLAYTAILPNPTATFTVTPTTTEAHATVELEQGAGGFTATPNGSASAALTAPTGDGVTTTVITLRITAQDGATQQSYAVTVTQAAPSTNANLDALAISSTTLSPTFASGTTAYAAALPSDDLTFTVTPTVQESHATVEVQQDAGGWVAVTSGSPSAALTPPAPDGLTPTTISVRVTPQAGAPTQTYTITVTRLAPPAPVTAFFPLYDTSLALSTVPVLTGDVTAAEVLGGMDYSTMKDGATNSPATVWHDGTGASVTVSPTVYQRAIITGGTWPAGDTDLNPNRWVEFVVSTSQSKTFTVDAISLWAGSGGGANLFYRCEYSTSADFSGAVELTAISVPNIAALPTGSLVKNDMYFRSVTGQSIVVPAGSALYLRFLPWNQATGTATGKYLQLQQLTVHGWVQ